MPAWKLPPLILHPFANSSSADKLVEASRATLTLSGLIPAEPGAAGQLEERLLAGRYCELAMLFYLGKDLERWLTQCLEFAEGTPALRERSLRSESFAALLVEDPPEEVKAKLTAWGVNEYSTIFARALGLHAVFASPPSRDLLALDFIRHYHHFADYAFACRQRLFSAPRISSSEFQFDLYASSEYARMLEEEWGTA